MNPYNSSEIRFTCNSDQYDAFWEILKYVGTVFYQGIGLILHSLIIKTILITERQYYKKSSFFQIFVVDSIASSVMILNSLLFGRLFMYVPPLCSIVGPYFWNPSILLQFLYTNTNHARFAKSLTQIFLVLNRMSCVLMPLSYDQMWKKLTPVVWIILILLPFAGNWNCIISRVYIGAFRGGFTLNYMKAVDWAALSMFQSIFILTALFFTVICTIITVYRLILMQGRVKLVERSLCISSISISATFLLVGATQLAYAFCPICHTQTYFSLYNAQLLAFDTFTVGSGVVMIITDTKLRTTIIPCTFLPKKTSSASGHRVKNGNSISLY